MTNSAHRQHAVVVDDAKSLLSARGKYVSVDRRSKRRRQNPNRTIAGCRVCSVSECVYVDSGNYEERESVSRRAVMRERAAAAAAVVARRPGRAGAAQRASRCPDRSGSVQVPVQYTRAWRRHGGHVIRDAGRRRERVSAARTSGHAGQLLHGRTRRRVLRR